MRSPDNCCWFPDHSNSSHWSFNPTVLPINLNIYSDQCEPITIYYCLTLLVILHLCSPNYRHLQTNYCLKGVDIHGWGVYYRHCYQYCYCNVVITETSIIEKWGLHLTLLLIFGGQQLYLIFHLIQCNGQVVLIIHYVFLFIYWHDPYDIACSLHQAVIKYIQSEQTAISLSYSTCMDRLVPTQITWFYERYLWYQLIIWH